MSPLLIPILALLIPIVAILAGTWTKVEKMRAETTARLGKATGHLDDEMAAARADRERLRQRVEALEAIVTSEGYDLEREARRAGLVPPSSAGRIDPGLLGSDPVPTPDPTHGDRQRSR